MSQDRWGNRSESCRIALLFVWRVSGVLLIRRGAFSFGAHRWLHEAMCVHIYTTEVGLSPLLR